MSGTTTSTDSPISSGNYLIDTLYLYSRNTGYVIGERPQAENYTPDNLCINALQFIFNEAKQEEILNPNIINHIDSGSPLITNLFNIQSEDKSGVAKEILNTFFTAFARLQTNLFDLETITEKFDIAETINNFNLYANQDTQKFKGIDTLRENYKPSQVYYKIFTSIGYSNPFYIPDDYHIQTTFDYVLFLFSISMAKNWHANWINIEDLEKENTDKHINLRRRNFMIVSFLSIFTAYFKPILDALLKSNSSARLPKQYIRIITFINKIIYLHNSILDNHTEINNTPYNPINNNGTTNKTTYEYNKLNSLEKSRVNNQKNINVNEEDESYKILDKYNEELSKNNEFEYKFIDHKLSRTTDASLKTRNLMASPGIKKTEILLPELPSAAAWEPILTRKLGLAGVEINKVLNDINLDMCKSEISLSSSKTQFKVTGIPFSNIDYIRNYLFNIKDDYTDEKLENHGSFSMLDYFVSILKFHHPEINKFRILTAINNHYDQIYFTKVGSFDLHISRDTYKTVIDNCKSGSQIKFITGIQAYKINRGLNKLTKALKKIENLQTEHRVMLIFDMNEKEQTVYYFEPFGQFYPVYDMYGRLIPDMQERVISQKLHQLYSSETFKINTPSNIVMSIPYTDTSIHDNPKYCNTGVFNLSRAAYLGHGNLYNSIINSVINSTELHDDKTLDWASGYCGLIIIFMMVMVKINCDMPPDKRNKRTVDDILIWFGEFNSDPFFTFDNLLSRFILRGFGKLVENILKGKQAYIQPIKFDLADAQITAKFKVGSQGQLIAESSEHLKANAKDLELTNILYNLIGINPKLIGSDANNEEIRKKLNSIVKFIYNTVPHEEGALYEEITAQDGSTKGEPLATNEDLDSKLSNVNVGSANKQVSKLVPIRIGSVFGSWISNFFSKKGRVYINPLAANNVFKPDAATGKDTINTNPKLPRVLFIDIQPNPASTATF